ncbi:MAG: hypothetical protein WC651_02065 [Candidatus Gracilibacteria bacterium]
MEKICKQCGGSFEILDFEKKFYEKAMLPLSCLCSDCREQRRLVFRNERCLYGRTCDLCGKNILSTYAPEVPYTVYCNECWWGDKWDAEKYAQEFDFSRPFFEQIDELWKKVPQLNLVNSKSQNSDYANFSEQEHNCYLVFASNRNEDCYYSEYIWDSKKCMDCLNVKKCQLLFMCVDCSESYECFYSQNCHNSHSLRYCYDCKGCHDLFACAGLRNKSYSILNKQYSKEEYFKILENEDEKSRILKEYELLKTKVPRLYANILNCEDVTGDYLNSCSRAHLCFNSFDLQDAFFVENSPGGTRDVCHISGCTHCELSSELVSVAYGHNCHFVLYSHTGISDSKYSVLSTSCSDLFGCVGLRNKKYCILNKQYSKEDYEKLVVKIIEHMKKTRLPDGQAGEWGEFFPISLSPFYYNETVANEYYPLDKSVAEKLGGKWKEKEEREYREATKEILKCDDCGKNYKIVKPELDFYKNFKISLPKLCPGCRHVGRLKLRNPKKLWTRKCDKCGVEIKTSYAPERKEKVYCEECYLKEVY